MDTIYPPSSFNASEVIDLKEFFEDYTKINENVTTLLPFHQTKKKKGDTELLGIQHILQNLGVPLKYDEIKKLSKKCSTDNLTSNDESPELPEKKPQIANSKSKMSITHTLSFNARKLQVVQCHETFKNCPTLSQALYHEKRRLPNRSYIKDETALLDIPPGSDFQLTTRFYQPFHMNNHAKSLKFHYEIVICGKTKLTQLRDEILCPSDAGFSYEVYSTDVESEEENPKEKFPSGFFFIENTFYNDFRHPNAIDYSRVIRNWAVEKEIGELKTAEMEGVCINDLKLRLGYPYLYMHQGDCEHLIVFSDAKLIQRNDILSSACYPYFSDINKTYVYQKCYICCAKFSKWLVYKSDRLPYEKTYMCTKCCKSYNFIDGKRIGNFELYPFRQIEVKNNIVDPLF